MISAARSRARGSAPRPRRSRSIPGMQQRHGKGPQGGQFKAAPAAEMPPQGTKLDPAAPALSHRAEPSGTAAEIAKLVEFSADDLRAARMIASDSDDEAHAETLRRKVDALLTDIDEADPGRLKAAYDAGFIAGYDAGFKAGRAFQLAHDGLVKRRAEPDVYLASVELMPNGSHRIVGTVNGEPIEWQVD